MWDVADPAGAVGGVDRVGTDEVPPDWAGGPLVVYARGYVSPLEPPQLPDDLDESMEAFLLGKGFAIAYSSFSETGWAVKDGAIRTRQLLGHFKDGYDNPAHVYLVGASQGGLIALSLAEQNPNLFDGMLAISGAVGGGPLQMEYLTHTRVLFDALFRESLNAMAEGDAASPLTQGAALVLAALGDGVYDADAAGLSPTFPEGILAPVLTQLVMADVMGPEPRSPVLATMAVDGTPLFNWTPDMIYSGAFVGELIETLVTVLWFNIYGTQDLLARTNGHSPVSNTDVFYASPLLDAHQIGLLNLGVERVADRPAGRNYLAQWYDPSGRLRFPVITVHLSRDPAVPILHEQKLAEVVSEAGRSHLLKQHEVVGFGHGNVGPEFANRVLAAFGELVFLVSGEIVMP